MLARAWMQFNTNRAWLTRALRWAPAAIWMGGIFYLSHQSAPLEPVASEVNPFISHAVVYAGLALLFYVAVAPAERFAPRWVPSSIAFALTVLYGVTDEVHQGFITGRVASEADLAIDALGAAAAIALLLIADQHIAMRAHEQPRQSPKNLP